jgi:hypothetical protein
VPLDAFVLALVVAAGDPDTLHLDTPDPSRTSWAVPAAHAGGFLLGMRISVGVLWPEAYDPTRLAAEGRQLRLAYTRPPELRSGGSLLESDGDPAWVNAIGHGVFGAEIYGRTRSCGHGAVAALLTTVAASTAWEYALEAPHKRPSAIDLAWTPLVGGLLGEGRFRLHRWLSARRSAPWLLFAVDPLGEAERRALRTRC